MSLLSISNERAIAELPPLLSDARPELR